MKIKMLDLGLTTRCNLNKCALCFRSKTPSPIPKLDLDPNVVKNCLTKELLNNLYSLSLVGNVGDIMFYPYIFEILDYISNVGKDDLVVCTDTNGSARSVSWWEELGKKMKQIKSSHVRFCLDGLEDTYSIYRIGGNYKKIIKNMSAFIKGGGNAVWKFIVFKHNEHQIDEASKIAKELGCCLFMVITSGVHNEILEESTIYKQEQNNEGVLCRSLDLKHITIDADGEVMPCCYYRPLKNKLSGEKIYWDDIRLMVRYVKDKIKLNIYTSSIEEAIETSFFKFLYKNYRNLPLCNMFCGSSRRRPDNVAKRIDVFQDIPNILKLNEKNNPEIIHRF